jgi:cytochrome c oxidase assembly factor CtaG
MPDPTLTSILLSWSWEPLILLGLGTAVVGYAYAFYHFHHHGWLPRLTRRGLIRRRHPWLFALSILTLFVALLSPLAALADLLFTAHMVQHMLLIMVAPPLILSGLPSPLIRWLIIELKARRILAWLTDPIFAFALFNLNLWLWHIPAFYEAALSNTTIHHLEHALFFYTAVFFWWRVIDPTRGWFPLWHWPPARWLYLLVAAPPSYVLGSILWISSGVLYSHYTAVPRLWGFSALADQQLGGMLMWAQGWMFFMVSMAVFYLAYHPEAETA